MNSAEIEQRNIALIGDSRKQYSLLFREVAALHLYWDEFLELFASETRRLVAPVVRWLVVSLQHMT